jgi:hypothetical protein
MKAKLTFTLPDEHAEHLAAVNASALGQSLYEFDQWLRQEEKYTERNDIPIDELREKLRDIMGLNGLSFNSPIFM